MLFRSILEPGSPLAARSGQSSGQGYPLGHPEPSLGVGVGGAVQGPLAPGWRGYTPTPSDPLPLAKEPRAQEKRPGRRVTGSHHPFLPEHTQGVRGCARLPGLEGVSSCPGGNQGPAAGGPGPSLLLSRAPAPQAETGPCTPLSPSPQIGAALRGELVPGFSGLTCYYVLEPFPVMGFPRDLSTPLGCARCRHPSWAAARR